jgi:hypothetical protein
LQKVTEIEDNILTKKISWSLFRVFFAKDNNRLNYELFFDNFENIVTWIDTHLQNAIYANINSRDMWNIIESYLWIAVEYEDLQDSDKILANLKEFLKRADDAKYELHWDINLNKMASIIWIDHILKIKNYDFTNLNFILNQVQWNYFEINWEKKLCDREYLLTEADKMFDGNNEKLKEKWAKLYIGLWSYTDSFKINKLKKIANLTVDRDLSKKKNLQTYNTRTTLVFER